MSRSIRLEAPLLTQEGSFQSDASRPLVTLVTFLAHRVFTDVMVSPDEISRSEPDGVEGRVRQTLLVYPDGVGGRVGWTSGSTPME